MAVLYSFPYTYSRQIEAVIKQFIRVFGSFSYKTGDSASGPGQLLPIPCKYGDASRTVSQIIKNNSENTAVAVPMFAVYIKDMQLNSNRRRPPLHENVLSITEREIDPETNRYTDEPGNTYEVTRLSPVPYDIKIQVDYMFSNTSQLWQIIEQVNLLFNPSMEMQFNENPLDWSAQVTVELESFIASSKTIPVGTDDNITVASWIINVPWWLNPPAKVKKLFDIRTIISDIGPDQNADIITWNANDFVTAVTSVSDHKISVTGNQAVLLSKFGGIVDEQQNIFDWSTILENFRTQDITKLYLKLRPVTNIHYTLKDVYASVTRHSTEENKLILQYVENTLPQTTVANVNDIIDPREVFPGNNLTVSSNVRYLILKAIPENTVAWGSFSAPANSIIEYISGAWTISFNPNNEPDGAIVKNSLTNKLYVLLSDNSWVSAIEGIYSVGFWTLVEKL